MKFKLIVQLLNNSGNLEQYTEQSDKLKSLTTAIEHFRPYKGYEIISYKIEVQQNLLDI